MKLTRFLNLGKIKPSKWRVKDGNSQVGKGGLPPLQLHQLQILKGSDKPPFPTCEFLSLE